MSCPNLAVPNDVMQHVVRVESSFNPYAIGVVGGRLARQPRNLAEALATVRMLEGQGYNFSLGLAQVNRYNLARYGLGSYERAFDACPNLQAGSRILAECYGRSGGNWGKSFSCYYSGNFSTGFRHGYVQKIYASMREAGPAGNGAAPIEVIGTPSRKVAAAKRQMVPVDAENIVTKRAGAVTTSQARTTMSLPQISEPPGTTAVVLQPADAAKPVAPQPIQSPQAPPPGDNAFVF